MNAAIDSDDGNPVLRGLARDGIADWKGRLESLVRTGVQLGEIREGTSPRRIANTIVAALEGALMISRIEDSRSALVDAQATLNEVLDGIRC